MVEDGGGEEVGENVPHGDGVGDEIDHRAVWVPAVLRRARVHAFGFDDHEIVHVLTPSFAGDDLEEQQEGTRKGLEIRILV